ncbi:MAG: hypothetical protein AAFV53_30540, partial [Myxococcota bacterium]
LAEGLEDRVRLLAGCVAGGADPDCVEDTVRAREAVTVEDVQRVARDHLSLERRALLSVLPERLSRRALPDSEPLDLEGR